MRSYDPLLPLHRVEARRFAPSAARCRTRTKELKTERFLLHLGEGLDAEGDEVGVAPEARDPKRGREVEREMKLTTSLSLLERW